MTDSNGESDPIKGQAVSKACLPQLSTSFRQVAPHLELRPDEFLFSTGHAHIVAGPHYAAVLESLPRLGNIGQQGQGHAAHEVL